MGKIWQDNHYEFIGCLADWYAHTNGNVGLILGLLIISCPCGCMYLSSYEFIGFVWQTYSIQFAFPLVEMGIVQPLNLN